MLRFVAIIPARLASTRLPRKPLADIDGVPMVIRVARRAAESGASDVIVATDSDEVLQACAAFDVHALLTSAAHPTGTDRLAQAAELLGLSDDTLVVNVQGDEPLIPPAAVRRVAELLSQRADCAIATVAHPISDAQEFFNPNVVKVVVDAQGRALLFSRAPIPWSRDAFSATAMPSPSHLPSGFAALRHVGLYAYRSDFLRAFPRLSRAPIEEIEALEQLRALWHGYRIAVGELPEPLPPGVDTESDLAHVRSLFTGAAST